MYDASSLNKNLSNSVKKNQISNGLRVENIYKNKTNREITEESETTDVFINQM